MSKTTHPMLGIEMKKTYHVHINPNPHHRSPSFPMTESGPRFNVQRIHRGNMEEWGTVDFNCDSRLRLWLYLLWLRLRGYRRDERKW